MLLYKIEFKILIIQQKDLYKFFSKIFEFNVNLII